MSDILASASSGETGQRPSAVLLGTSATDLDRMPAFREAAATIAVVCARRVEGIAGAPVRGELLGVRIEKLQRTLDQLPLPGISAVLDAPKWTTKLLAHLDPALMGMITDSLCGSDGVEPPGDADRPFTTIDQRLAQIFCEQLVESLTANFGGPAAAPVAFEAINMKLDGKLFGKPGHTVAVVDFRFDAIGRSGQLRLVLPQPAVEVLRYRMAQPSLADDASYVDAGWSRRFETEIGRTSIVLTAIVDAETLTLGDIAGLEIGHVIALTGPVRSRVKLQANQKTYMRGELGQANGCYTVRVEEVASTEEVADAPATAQ